MVPGRTSEHSNSTKSSPKTAALSSTEALPAESETSMAADETLFHENRAYQYAAQHQALWQQEQQERGANSAGASTASSPADQLRSIPIAIVRPPSETGGPSAGFETDDDDEDESVIDVVERDAIRLRKKYGDKVIAASYQPGMADAKGDILSKTMLRAPYLGSLSRSENYLASSLPPISLSDEPFAYTVEPPADTRSYGSLRESHQRGTFLDGPSSYREPASGRVMQLHRGLRYQAKERAGNGQPEPLSIGERMQQSRQLKEIKRKQEERQGGNKNETGVSSLATMMDKVSQQEDSNGNEQASTGIGMSVAAAVDNHPSTLVPEELEDQNRFDPPNMLSTSLTAFEILRTSSKVVAYQQNHTQRFVQQQQHQQHQQQSVVASVPHAPSPTILPTEAEIREQRFQPLSRSLSDPTPHHLQQSPLISPTLEQLNSPHSSLAPANPGWPPAAYGMTGIDLGPPATYGYVAASPATQSLPANAADNPDTDAAFDMDME